MPIPKPPFHPAVAEPFILGTDVSRWSSLKDWPALYEQGVRFMFAQTSYGAKAAPKALEHVSGAHAAGVVPGCYHYLRGDMAADAQASAFIAAVSAIEKKIGACVALALDLEDPNSGGEWPREAYEATALQWIKLVRAYFDDRPVAVYIGADYAKQLRLVPWFAESPLWLAAWKTSTPKIPAPWSDWAVWQYAGGTEDWNVSRMSVEEFRAMMGLS